MGLTPTLPRMKPHVTLTAILMPAQEGGYVALNPETGTTTQGESIEDAVDHLREATRLFLQETGHPELPASFITQFTLDTP